MSECRARYHNDKDQCIRGLHDGAHFDGEHTWRTDGVGFVIEGSLDDPLDADARVLDPEEITMMPGVPS